MIFFRVGVMYSGEYDVCDVTALSVLTPGKLEKCAAWPRWESNLRPLEYILAQCSALIYIEGTRLSSEILHTRTDLTA